MGQALQKQRDRVGVVVWPSSSSAKPASVPEAEVFDPLEAEEETARFVVGSLEARLPRSLQPSFEPQSSTAESARVGDAPGLEEGGAPRVAPSAA
eukprot:7502024-Pyramimonas_sp.AAC.1